MRKRIADHPRNGINRAISGRSSPTVVTLNRPVTPEVAGSSPVAPVLYTHDRGSYPSRMDPKEQVVRALAEARRRGEFDQVRSLLAEEVVWHEPGGDANYSGDHRTIDEVLALMRKLARTTNLTLEPQEVLVTDDHAVARTRWWAERAGTRVEGNELGAYRFEGGKIAEVWFWYDGYDQSAHDFVFASDEGRVGSR
jgi:uncharacterized protein